MGFSQDLSELLTCLSLVAAVSYVTDLQLFAGVCVGIQWLSALYGIPNQTERYFDLTGSATYATVSMLAYYVSESVSWRDTLLTAFVWLWCVRLGSFLYWRICECGVDKRFADIIVNPLCFLAAWNIQGLWVFFTLLSVLLSVTHGSDDPEVKVLDIIGTSMWVVGYAIELTADYQKTKFRHDKRNDGKFITSGLWGYSRHPNYFGEILMWIGVFLVAVHTLPSFALQCAAAVSPTFMTLLIIFRSGIPLLEEAADERWGKLKEYQQYKAQTSVLVRASCQPRSLCVPSLKLRRIDPLHPTPNRTEATNRSWRSCTAVSSDACQRQRNHFQTLLASNPRPSSAMGFLRNVVGTVVSVLLASVVAFYTDLQFYALVCFGIQWVSSLYAVPKQTERFLDVTGSFTYALLVLLAYVMNTPVSWRGSLLTAFVWLWCVRLGAFLFLRISECGEDKRFVEIRVNPLRFFSVWNIQGLWVLLTVLPVLLALTHGINDPQVSPQDVVGSGLWVVGYVMEVVADYQKTRFRRNQENKGKFIQSGLWHYSRHPFGVEFWWRCARQCSAAVECAQHDDCLH